MEKNLVMQNDEQGLPKNTVLKDDEQGLPTVLPFDFDALDDGYLDGLTLSSNLVYINTALYSIQEKLKENVDSLALKLTGESYERDLDNKDADLKKEYVNETIRLIANKIININKNLDQIMDINRRV